MRQLISQLASHQENAKGVLIVKGNNGTEQNICYKEDVEKAKKKFWEVKKIMFQDESLVDFEGDEEQTSLHHVDCNRSFAVLNGNMLVVNNVRPNAVIRLLTPDGCNRVQTIADNDGNAQIDISTIDSGCYIVFADDVTMKFLKK